MVYRAKVTKIIDIVENYINVNSLHYVRDTKDVYLEVKSEELADVLENINTCKEKELKLIDKLQDILED